MSKPSQPDSSGHLFQHGIASGDPTTSAVTLWTSVPGRAGATVDWVAEPLGGGDASAGSAQVPSDGIVNVRVEGLTPGTRYRYRFELGDHAIEGTTRTLPADGSNMRVAVTCCARWTRGSFAVYSQVADAEPDLVLHVGDYIYEHGIETDEVRRHDPPWECRTADDYFRRYAQYRTDPHLQRLHAVAPWVAIWDDHEVANDAFRRNSPGHEGSDASYARRREVALEAFARWMPQRAEGNGPTSGDRLLAAPGLADIVMIDTRLAGREEPIGGGGGPKLPDGEQRRLLSDAQWTWLDHVLEQCRAPWLVLVSPVQFSPLRLAPVPSLRQPPVRWLINPDQWDGYPAERARLLEMLRRHEREDVLVLSGDLHGRFLTGMPTDGAASRVVHEITTPSVSAPPFAELIRNKAPVPPPVLRWWLRLLNPHIDTMDLERHGATIVDLSPTGLDATGIGASELNWSRGRRCPIPQA